MNALNNKLVLNTARKISRPLTSSDITKIVQESGRAVRKILKSMVRNNLLHIRRDRDGNIIYADMNGGKCKQYETV